MTQSTHSDWTLKKKSKGKKGELSGDLTRRAGYPLDSGSRECQSLLLFCSTQCHSRKSYAATDVGVDPQGRCSYLWTAHTSPSTPKRSMPWLTCFDSKQTEHWHLLHHLYPWFSSAMGGERNQGASLFQYTQQCYKHLVNTKPYVRKRVREGSNPKLLRSQGEERQCINKKHEMKQILH